MVSYSGFIGQVVLVWLTFSSIGFGLPNPLPIEQQTLRFKRYLRSSDHADAQGPTVPDTLDQSTIRRRAVALTPTSSSIPGYTYYGCYTDANPLYLGIGSQYLLNGQSYTSLTGTTWNTCTSYCATYQYAGLSGGSTCRCGNSFVYTPILGLDALCATPCTGNSVQTCGGVGRLTVFRNSNYGLSSSLSSLVLVTTTPPSSAAPASALSVSVISVALSSSLSSRSVTTSTTSQLALAQSTPLTPIVASSSIVISMPSGPSVAPITSSSSQSSVASTPVISTPVPTPASLVLGQGPSTVSLTISSTTAAVAVAVPIQLLSPLASLLTALVPVQTVPLASSISSQNNPNPTLLSSILTDFLPVPVSVVPVLSSLASVQAVSPLQSSSPTSAATTFPALQLSSSLGAAPEFVLASSIKVLGAIPSINLAITQISPISLLTTSTPSPTLLASPLAVSSLIPLPIAPVPLAVAAVPSLFAPILSVLAPLSLPPVLQAIPSVISQIQTAPSVILATPVLALVPSILAPLSLPPVLQAIPSVISQIQTAPSVILATPVLALPVASITPFQELLSQVPVPTIATPLVASSIPPVAVTPSESALAQAPIEPLRSIIIPSILPVATLVPLIVPDILTVPTPLVVAPTPNPLSLLSSAIVLIPSILPTLVLSNVPENIGAIQLPSSNALNDSPGGAIVVIPSSSFRETQLPTSTSQVPSIATPTESVIESGIVVDREYSWAFLSSGIVKVDDLFLSPLTGALVGFLSDRTFVSLYYDGLHIGYHLVPYPAAYLSLAEELHLSLATLGK